jgi:hypothetical protein
MASGQGTATIDFGVFPGIQEASVVVTDATISATSKAEAYIMADDTTADHTAEDHRYIGIWMKPTCGTPIAATGFTIYGRASEQLEGTFKLRYVWAD